MSAEVFVDTNVLLYARDASEPARQPLAEAWLRALWQARRGRTSIQVLQEYYVNATRKLRPGLPAEAARADVRAFWAWQPPAPDAALVEQAWRLQDRFPLSWWDALVVASAQAQACGVLLTEDLQDGMRFDRLRVVDPFAHGPDAVLTSG